MFFKEEKLCIFKGLIVVDGFEKYLGVKFFGVKCFLFEGGDVLVLMFKELIYCVGESG